MEYNKEQIQISNKEIPTSIKKHGVGHSFCHHGEILQGAFYSEYHKDYIYGLTTFRCNLFYSKATFIRDENSREINIFPENRNKAKKAAKEVLKFLNLNIGGKIRIESNILPKLGFGSSTADVLSTIRAVSDLVDYKLSEEIIAELAVNSEQASDSLMFEKEVLFAQRKGIVLDTYNKTLPPYIALGFRYNSFDNGFDTLGMKPLNYSKEEQLEFKKLRNILFHAIDNQSLSLVGEVSTRSALINQKYYPKSNLNEIINIHIKYDAVGIQISHSGSLVGIIWEPNCTNVFEKIEQVKKELKKIKINSTWIFNYGI